MLSRVVSVLTLVSHVSGEAPVAKVMSMLSDLQATIIKEGDVAQKEYAEFSEWCEDRASDLGFEIKTGKSESESLHASIAQESATTETLQSKVDSLIASIATDEADLKAATSIRTKENADFETEEKELMETIDMLRRAAGIIERDMQGGASMMQLSAAQSLQQALSTMLQASMISSSDAEHLNAFIQSSHKESADDEEPGAPAAAVYKSQSGGILDTLRDLSEKAESQLDTLRKTETANRQNFELLKQSLQDELRFANNDLSDAKRGISVSAEKKATAEGDLRVTSDELAEDIKAKSSLHHDCMTKSEAFEAATKSRGEELTALAEAKKVLSEATGVSFLQVSSARAASLSDASHFAVVRMVRELARKHQSAALSQLASKMSSAMQLHDPFEKITGLISDMIERLESEASADASKKAYCDKETSETNEKKSDKTAEIEKLTTRIDQMDARSSQAKEEVATLQSELAKLAKSQAEMDRMRQEENTAFTASKAELDKGLTGIKMALKILNEYYAKADKAHAASEAGSGIIGLLEVCEADFSKNLATAIADEDMAAAEYDAETKENDIERTTKQQDVKYKTKEFKSLDKTSGELKSDRSGVHSELDAVLEYLAKINEECIEKAESYAARKARFESEIAGLKSALRILEDETAFVQVKAAQHSLRGAVE